MKAALRLEARGSKERRPCRRWVRASPHALRSTGPRRRSSAWATSVTSAASKDVPKGEAIAFAAGGAVRGEFCPPHDFREGAARARSRSGGLELAGELGESRRAERGGGLRAQFPEGCGNVGDEARRRSRIPPSSRRAQRAGATADEAIMTAIRPTNQRRNDAGLPRSPSAAAAGAIRTCAAPPRSTTGRGICWRASTTLRSDRPPVAEPPGDAGLLPRGPPIG